MAQNKWSDKAINDFASTAWLEACEINPTNPFVVAQNIKGMYEALKELRHMLDKFIMDGTIPLNHPDIVHATMSSNEALWVMNKVLTAIEKGEAHNG